MGPGADLEELSPSVRYLTFHVLPATGVATVVPVAGAVARPSVGPLRVVRAELLIAAGAAERWPPGLWHRWFLTEAAEEAYGYPCRVPVATARREGGPGVAVAAFRVARAGRARTGVTWREVWTAQAHLVDLAHAAGVKDYLDTLRDDPLRLARLWRDLADLIGGNDDPR